MSETQSQTQVKVEDVIRTRYEEIKRQAYEKVKKIVLDNAEVYEYQLKGLAKLNLGLIEKITSKEGEEIDLMGFDITEVSVSVYSVENEWVSVDIILPNGRTYECFIDLTAMSDMKKEVYMKFNEEFTRLKQEFEKIAEEEKIRRKLQEYEELKKENMKLKEKIRELEGEIIELKNKCRKEDSEEE